MAVTQAVATGHAARVVYMVVLGIYTGSLAALGADPTAYALVLIYTHPEPGKAGHGP